jgi:hypothetical protein
VASRLCEKVFSDDSGSSPSRIVIQPTTKCTLQFKTVGDPIMSGTPQTYRRLQGCMTGRNGTELSVEELGGEVV